MLSSQITNDAQTQTQTQTYSYDPAGRLLSSRKSETGNQNPAVATYSYNNWGQLANYSGPNGTATYSYSYNNQRISSYENGTLTDFTYHGNELFETYTGANRISKYVHSPMGTVGVYNAINTYNGIVTDTQNSIIGVLNSSLNTQNSTLVNTFAYAPFGGVRYQQSDSFNTSLQWLSRQYDETSGNHYLMNRYYNASTGRFNSTDWYEYVDTDMPYSMNLYQYGYGNAGMYVDRDGRKAVAELIDTVSLYQDWHDYINPIKYGMHLVGGSTSDVYYIYDDGTGSEEIKNNEPPVAISFGILTFEDGGLKTAIKMAKDIEKPAYYITNNTRMLLFDLVESTKTKILGINSATVEAMKKVMIGSYNIEKINGIDLKIPTEWIVHSQGGIHLSESLQEVDSTFLRRIELISTFGAAAWQYEKDPQNYVHYVSTRDAVSFLLGKTMQKMRKDETKIIGNFGLHMFMSGYWQQYLLENGYYYKYLEYYEKGSHKWSIGMDRFAKDKRINRRKNSWINQYLAIQGYYSH